MQYSIIFASLATVIVAAPMEMKDMQNMATMDATKQADDYTSYGAYGKYNKYENYDNYPDGVEEAAKMMGMFPSPSPQFNSYCRLTHQQPKRI